MIHFLEDQLWDELGEAKCYALKAMKCAHMEKSGLAADFKQMAIQELAHFDMLLDMLKEVNMEKQEISEEVYNYMTEVLMDKYSEVKSIIANIK